MASTYRTIEELYRTTLVALSESPEAWKAFLESAGRNYKLPVPEQALVHAQRPDATAVLELERWDALFGRRVKRGSVGIAVFGAPGTGRLRYYFDVSDTAPGRAARPLPLWAGGPEQEAAIVGALHESFGADARKGTIEPIAEIGEIAKEHGVLFHTDAVQAYAQVPINVDEMHIDMLSASGHKLNGPKGIGFLYIRKGVKIRSFVHGGAQERSRRAGTENIPGIVGLGAAVERAMRIMDSKTQREIELRDYLIGRLENEIPHCWLNGHRTKRLPNNINFSFLFIEGESMLIMLDMKGICASSGSACTSGSLDPSHVLLAIGLKHEEAHGSLRLTLSEDSTKEEMDIVAEEVKKIVQRLRDMSPLYEDFLKSQKNN